MALRVKKDDVVVVISGKDRGSQGRVLRVLRERDRVIVEGVNRVKRHMRPNNRGVQGGIIEKEASIHISNVMLLDTKSNKPTRVRSSINKDGKKIRVAIKSGTALDG